MSSASGNIFEPSTLNGTAELPPPPIPSSAHVTIDTKQMQSDLERRQQELEIKARELAAREEALRQAGGEFRREHNWPPLPAFCPVKPCFFQDISVDIKPEFQKTVQLGYNLWVGFVFTLILNIIAAIVLISTGTGTDDYGKNLAFGILVFVFFVPLTYVSWFRPLYKAFKNDSSFNFMVFFFIFFMQIIVCGLWSLGLPMDGPCGLSLAIGALSRNKILSLFLFIVTACWMGYVAGSILYLLRVHAIYRSSGATMAKARSEFAQGIISNQYVQQTVSQAAQQSFASAAENIAPQPAGVR